MVDWNSEEDSGVEQDLNEIDLPALKTATADTTKHDFHSNSNTTSEGIHSDDNDSAAHSDKEEEVAGCHDSNEREAESESEAAAIPKGAMTEESLEKAREGEIEEAAKPTACMDGSQSPAPHDDHVVQPQNGVESAGEEQDTIQELMTRQDTAVIFPEPVSDHEEQEEASRSNGAVLEEEDRDLDQDHEDHVELQCPQCHQIYAQDFLLRDHILAQHPEIADKHACPQCGVTFALRMQLEKHLALHSPISQVCKICKKTFANVYRLQRHMISHEESTELRKFKCPECGKAFKFKHHLKEHVRIHSGEKPFACSNCGKRFSHSGSYSSHMTSKKCWVVSLRSPRKGDSVGVGIKAMPERSSDGLLRPLVPKAHENGNGIDLSASMAASVYQNMYPPHLIPFDPSGAHLQAQILAQFNGSRPFLPQMPFGVGHMMNPMMPGMPFSFPPFSPEKSGRSDEARSEVDMSEKKVNTSMESTKSGGVDENQNAKKLDKEVKAEPEGEKAVRDRSKSSDSTEEMTEEAKQAHLEAVKKVLEIVDATVSEQQKHRDEKTALSKLVGQDNVGGRGLSMLASAAAEKLLQMKQEQKEVDEDGEQTKEAPLSLHCRFCQEVFNGPIDLHQHERYLCKQNKDIHSSGQSSHQQSHSEMHSKNGPVSPSSISTERTEEEPEENDENVPEKDMRRGRARSFITEPQSSFLRAHYTVNPFPTKIELQSIADNIKLAKRVVQVWFQNMRARDRRRGKQLPEPSQASPSLASVAPARKASPPLVSSYIPVVPQLSFQPPVPGTMAAASYAGPRFNGQVAPPGVQPPLHRQNPARPTARNLTTSFTMQQEPLDLSTHPKPQAAHCNSKPYDATTATAPPTEDAVLNLCTKQKDTEREEKLKHSAIYKYMQQEGMMPVEELNARRSASPSMPRWHHAAAAPVSFNTIPAHSNFSLSSTPERGAHPLTSTPLRPAHSPSLPPGSPNIMSSPIGTPPPSSLDSSFNSTLSGDSTTHSVLKPKRARRKSWRQVGDHVEAEEVEIEFEEYEDDENQPLRKKRRSWKHHRIEAADGLYACDQCDKMFNKQSSLARHKYEHSGQRPFPCDICAKAFKHKHHLTEHKRLHSGEKPFICKKCGKRFSHSGSFSQHMNHRYKYCKPLRMGEQGPDSDNEHEREESPEFEHEHEHEHEHERSEEMSALTAMA